jgi:RHH-type rel operon transcriptional repressor/antitoxin RelB
MCTSEYWRGGVVAETATLTIRVPKQQLERLARLAEATNRTKSFLAAEALTEFLDQQEWQVAAIQEAIDEIDSGVPTVSHERVVAWLKTWGTDHEEPMPE